MMDHPLVAQHFVVTQVVVVQAEQQLAQIGPRFDAVALDRETPSSIQNSSMLNPLARRLFRNCGQYK